MLKQRIITAVVLAAAFLATLFANAEWVFTGFVGILLLAAAWEWSALCGLAKVPAKLLFLAAVVLQGLWVASWSGLPVSIGGGNDVTLLAGEILTGNTRSRFQLVLSAAAAYWLLALALVASFPRGGFIWQGRWARVLLGLLMLLFAWSAMLVLRYNSGGQQLIIYVVLAVAAADIGAYFTGRRFGKSKLAKQVSPGKSWEGVAGGVLAVLLFALVFNQLVSLSASLIQLMLVALLIALASVVGDLFESMLKRHVGVKDSGRILPGHGGVMDRIDGLVAAMPVFALASLILQW